MTGTAPTAADFELSDLGRLRIVAGHLFACPRVWLAVLDHGGWADLRPRLDLADTDYAGVRVGAAVAVFATGLPAGVAAAELPGPRASLAFVPLADQCGGRADLSPKVRWIANRYCEEIGRPGDRR